MIWTGAGNSCRLGKPRPDSVFLKIEEPKVILLPFPPSLPSLPPSLPPPLPSPPLPSPPLPSPPLPSPPLPSPPLPPLPVVGGQASFFGKSSEKFTNTNKGLHEVGVGKRNPRVACAYWAHFFSRPKRAA